MTSGFFIGQHGFGRPSLIWYKTALSSSMLFFILPTMRKCSAAEGEEAQPLGR